MHPITDTPSTTRAPISEALGFANAIKLGTVFWLIVAGGAWAVFG